MAVTPEKLADQITEKAASALTPLTLMMYGWPAEFRGIMWKAVALEAQQRQYEAEREHKRGKST